VALGEGCGEAREAGLSVRTPRSPAAPPPAVPRRTRTPTQPARRRSPTWRHARVSSACGAETCRGRRAQQQGRCASSQPPGRGAAKRAAAAPGPGTLGAVRRRLLEYESVLARLAEGWGARRRRICKSGGAGAAWEGRRWRTWRGGGDKGRWFLIEGHAERYVISNAHPRSSSVRQRARTAG